jgi:hypothetical protein
MALSMGRGSDVCAATETTEIGWQVLIPLIAVLWERPADGLRVTRAYGSQVIWEGERSGGGIHKVRMGGPWLAWWTPTFDKF